MTYFIVRLWPGTFTRLDVTKLQMNDVCKSVHVSFVLTRALLLSLQSFGFQMSYL